MSQFTTYVDRAFLRKYVRHKPGSDVMIYSEEDRLWQSIFLFLNRHTQVILEADIEDVRSDPSLKWLVSGGRTRHVTCNKKIFRSIADPDFQHDLGPHTIFLLENSSVDNDRLQALYGFLFIRFNRLYSVWRWFAESSLIDVSDAAEVPFDWTCLKERAQILNACIICDKYIFGEDYKTSIRRNLGALIVSLLPEESQQQAIEVMIVTDVRGRCGSEGSSSHDMLNELHQYISAIRPGLRVDLSIANYGGKGHKDRCIFTNYGFFTCNDTFNFFNQKGNLSKETTITFHPLTNSDLLAIARKRLERIFLAEGFDYSWSAGSCENRILKPNTSTAAIN